MIAHEPKTKVQYVVTLEGAATGAEGPHLRTLRFILKRLLREQSLRCVGVTEVRLDPRDDVDSDGGAHGQA
jgi:hypothetical protein